ncbi:flagellar motor switch protein FliM [Enterobacterales bacterium CwR94]|nr:flagellar motor switch protein FliM [Enterobacterales bacterium CwR94]
MKLEISKLGRPYHKVPKIFQDNFDLLDAKLNAYFLKKFRVNIVLERIDYETDVQLKQCQILASEIGNLAFYIDRILLLNVLHDYYGLAKDNKGNVSIKETPISRTEERLRNKLAIELVALIVSDQLFGEDVTLKPDPAALVTHWAYRIDFSLAGYDEGLFSLLLDAAHVDRLLATLRRQNENSTRLKEDESSTRATFMTLPVQLTSRLASLPMTVADLYRLKTGDILPIAMPDNFPLYVGKQPLFNAVISEDRGKLFFSEFSDRSSETKHE